MLRHLPKRNANMCSHRHLHIRMLITSFTVVKSGRNPSAHYPKNGGEKSISIQWNIINNGIP